MPAHAKIVLGRIAGPTKRRINAVRGGTTANLVNDRGGRHDQTTGRGTTDHRVPTTGHRVPTTGRQARHEASGRRAHMTGRLANTTDPLGRRAVIARLADDRPIRGTGTRIGIGIRSETPTQNAARHIEAIAIRIAVPSTIDRLAPGSRLFHLPTRSSPARS